MFPRDARKTRSTSRSSLVSTQNSHDVNAPDSSVEQSGHVSRVVARRWLQTGQLEGGLRVADLANLFDRDPDGAHRAVAVEGARARPDGQLARAGGLHVFKRDLAHRRVRSDADAGGLVEHDTYLAHLAADRAGAGVEAALWGDTSGRHLQVQRALKLHDVAIACLDLGGNGALHSTDLKVACLGLGRERQPRVHADGQLVADVEPGDSDPALRAAEHEAGFVVQGRLLDDHRVAFLARLVRAFGGGIANTGVPDDLVVSQSGDAPDLLEPGRRIGGR